MSVWHGNGRTKRPSRVRWQWLLYISSRQLSFVDVVGATSGTFIRQNIIFIKFSIDIVIYTGQQVGWMVQGWSIGFMITQHNVKLNAPDNLSSLLNLRPSKVVRNQSAPSRQSMSAVTSKVGSARTSSSYASFIELGNGWRGIHVVIDQARTSNWGSVANSINNYLYQEILP